MTGSRKFLIVSCAALLAFNCNALEYAVGDHEIDVGFRSRIGFVNTDTNNAQTASLLVRANLASEWHDAVSTLIEYDYVTLGWEDQFSNGVFINDNAVIPDAEGGDVNQFFVDVNALANLTFRLGREAINFANQRFVGTNSFWQNEQTFDTVGLNYSFGFDSNIQYRFINNANRIQGDDAGRFLNESDALFEQTQGIRPARFLGDHEHETHLVFLESREWDFHTLQAYYLDIKNNDAIALSNQTAGVRYRLRTEWQDLRLLGHAELALQKQDNAVSNDWIEYFDVGAGFGLGSHQLTLNVENLGSQNNTSFNVALGSLHNHNGWVDKFTSTPAQGLRDVSLRYIWRSHPIKFDFRYHNFNAVDDAVFFGEEVDFDLSVNLPYDSELLLRYADFFGAHAGFEDERRIFVQIIYNI